MTPDEQEALSFRYIAPRVFRLSSGNIAICPMIGRAPPQIIEPKDFYALISFIPTMVELEALAAREDNARASACARPDRRQQQPTLDDLA